MSAFQIALRVALARVLRFPPFCARFTALLEVTVLALHSAARPTVPGGRS